MVVNKRELVLSPFRPWCTAYWQNLEVFAESHHTMEIEE
jgi:hypothetical protein